jgi:hypothetical protein
MNTQRTIFAAVVAVVFLFAGYNLYNYFSNQSEIQAQKDLESQKVAADREKRKAAEAEARRQVQAERKREQQKEERLAAERRAAQEAKRQKDAEEREAKRQEGLALKKKKDNERLQARIELARTPKHIEGLPEETIEKFNSIAARYIRDNPDELLKARFSDKTLHPRRSGKRLLKERTNPLMIYAAINPDIDILHALIDIGIDVNSANKAGYTPLMFAAAYNTPEVVQFLIEQGADISAKAYIHDLNALHIAALFNPKPDVIDALLDARMDIEAKTENEHTALLLAASDNRNLEIVERLATKGADKGVYDTKGRTALKIAEARMREEEGDSFQRISKDVNRRVLETLK